jgi:hypothetical protein
MDGNTETERYLQLVTAFIEIADGRPDVQLRGSSEPESLLYAVRLQPRPASAGVDMLLWPGGARMRSWSVDGISARGDGTERELNIALRDGFRWECLQFPDAQSLAFTLFQRMKREMDGAGAG